MITNNRLDKLFGPVGTWAGVFLFVVGVITTYTSFYGLILVLIGAFVGFSSSSTFIDFEKRRIKFSNNIFGIIPSGKWMLIDQKMKIGIEESNVTWRSYSRGNRTLDIADKDFRLILFDSDNQEIMQIKKTGSFDTAESACKELCNQLGLSRI